MYGGIATSALDSLLLSSVKGLDEA
jgi:hypothetical protein